MKLQEALAAHSMSLEFALSGAILSCDRAMRALLSYLMLSETEFRQPHTSSAPLLIVVLDVDLPVCPGVDVSRTS